MLKLKESSALKVYDGISFQKQHNVWFGRFYEWLVGITKNVLKKTLGRALVTLDELVTVVTNRIHRQ